MCGYLMIEATMSRLRGTLSMVVNADNAMSNIETPCNGDSEVQMTSMFSTMMLSLSVRYSGNKLKVFIYKIFFIAMDV